MQRCSSRWCNQTFLCFSIRLIRLIRLTLWLNIFCLIPTCLVVSLSVSSSFTFKCEVWADFYVPRPSYRNVTNQTLDTCVGKRSNISMNCWPIGRKLMWSTGSTLNLQASWVLKTWWSSWWKNNERKPHCLTQTRLLRSTSRMKKVRIMHLNLHVLISGYHNVLESSLNLDLKSY